MATCAWVEQEEQQAREQLGRQVHSERWLLGLNTHEDSTTSRERWRETATQIIQAAHLKCGAKEPAIHELANRLAG